jgi:cyclophilin family peptidyl-prolyl cis-trans isomerase
MEASLANVIGITPATHGAAQARKSERLLRLPRNVRMKREVVPFYLWPQIVLINMNSRSWWISLCLGFLLVSTYALAQESGAKNKSQPATEPTAKEGDQAGDPKGARAEFDRVYGEWKEMMARLAELNTSYQKAAENQKPAIEKQYNEVAAGGTKLADRLKAATEAAFAVDPNDKEVSQLLTVIAFTALRDDRYEEAQRLADLGLEHKPTDQQLARIAANAAFNLDQFEKVEPLVAKAAAGAPLSEPLQQLVAESRQYVGLWKQEQQKREAEAKADDLPRVKLKTNKGDITIELFENEAPNSVANFISLVEKGFYDGVPFHRVLPNFMAQGGDPQGTGQGGPGYRIKDEYANPGARAHFRGSLSMANTGQPNTNGSQFFLTFKPTPHLNGHHTVFGRVIEGFDVLPKIQRIDPEKPTGVKPDKIVKATVVRKRPHAYKPETLPE